MTSSLLLLHLDQLGSNDDPLRRFRSSNLQRLVNKTPAPLVLPFLFQQVLGRLRSTTTGKRKHTWRRRLRRRPPTGSIRDSSRGDIRPRQQPLNQSVNFHERIWRLRGGYSRAQRPPRPARRLEQLPESPWTPSRPHQLAQRLVKRKLMQISRRSLKTRQNDAISRLLAPLPFQDVVRTSRRWWTLSVNTSHPPTPPRRHPVEDNRAFTL